MSCHVRWGSWARVVVVCSLANHSREKCDCVTSIENKSLQLRASGPHSWWSLIKSSEKLKSAGNDNWYLLAGVGTLQLGRFWIWSANSLLVNHVKETHSLSWKKFFCHGTLKVLNNNILISLLMSAELIYRCVPEYQGVPQKKFWVTASKSSKSREICDSRQSIPSCYCCHCLFMA